MIKVADSPSDKATGVSSSSEARTPRRPVKRRALLSKSLVITSSFCVLHERKEKYCQKKAIEETTWEDI